MVKQSECKSRLLSGEDLKRIESAITAAEKTTSGEIVALVVPSSGEYSQVYWRLAAFGAILASLCLLFFHWEGWSYSVLEVLEAQVVGAVIGALAGLYPPLRRALLGKATIAERVHRESLANFTATGLHETRDRTGILIYVSELEHRVEILADRGIHAKLGQDYWKDQVSHIVAGIRKGKPGDALCEAIGQMGARLAEHFPRRSDDKDELANEVKLGHQKIDE